jgi:uncharacterized protein (TIGR02594 family)
MFTPVDFSPYPWMKFALAEVGEAEVPGKGSNPRICEYLAAAGLAADPDETPWCSAFVNWCMGQAKIQGTGRANARSWLNWSDKCLAAPRYGAVAVLWRERMNGAKGHVAFYVGENQGQLVLLGGNQGNQVKLSNYPRNRLLGYRWPPGYAIPSAT